MRTREAAIARATLRIAVVAVRPGQLFINT
jgi:hypothetical protein